MYEARWRLQAAWAAAIIVLGAATYYSSDTLTHGFVAYYAAGRLLAEGRLGPMAYDDAAFGQYLQHVTGSSVREIFVPNPPTMALMAWPLALLDAMTARAVWLFASLSAFLLACASLMRWRSAVYGATPAILLLVVLLNPAVFANLRVAQGYLFVFALFTATVLCLLRGRDRWAGVCLGLLLALKTAGVALLVVLIVRRRWQAVGTAVAVATVLALAIVPWIDNTMWVAYPFHVRELVARPASSVTAYQTTLSLFRHLCVSDATWNPSPAASCAPLAYTVPAVLVGGALLATLAVAMVARGSESAVLAAAVCLSELTLPAAAEPHFVLLGLPLAMLNLGPVSFAIFAALFLVPMEYTAQVFSAGWEALLGYPRVYAAWLLWALAIGAASRLRPAGTSVEPLFGLGAPR